MKKILFPIDFSGVSSHALDFAIDFNRKVKGQIILLHVIEAPYYAFWSEKMDRERSEVIFNNDLTKSIQSKLTEWERKIRDAGQEVKTHLKYGNPYRNIAKAIVSEKASLIIMGSKGASGIDEVFLGSNAERVVRYSDCPVLIIKEATQLDAMKNMVFASDLSEEQDWMAHKAKEVQHLLGLNMHVIRVKTPRNFLTEAAAQKQLKAFAKRNDLEDFTLNTIEAEFSDEGIAKFAEEISTGLIVIGTHGKTGLAHLFGGSRAEDLVNESKIPVLTFKMPFDKKL